MTMNRLKHFAGAFAVAAILASKGAIAADPLPVEAFASLPNMHNVKLSPNGQQIGYETHYNGRKVVVLENIDGSDRTMVPYIAEADIMTFHWATDSRVLVVYEFLKEAWETANAYTNTRLMGINRDGTESDWVVRNHEVKRVGSRVGTEEYPPAQFQHRILDLLHDDPEHILLSLDADLDDAYEVRKLNIHDGEYKIVQDDRRGIQFWYTDHNGVIRFGDGYVSGKSDYVSSLRGGDGTWITLRNTNWAQTYDVRGFTESPDVIFVSGPSKYGTTALYKLNLNTGEVLETVFEHKQYDLGGIISHPETGKPAGYYYTTDQPKSVYFDATMKKVQAAINKALPGTYNEILGKARGAHTYLIQASNSKDPGVYYWLDFRTKEMKVLGSYQPDLVPAKSAEKKSVSITARDGSTIPAYLTLPVGHDGTQTIPTVVLVHGGPQARDDANWDWRSQFLAARGYAVLQPNFRGSTGYGIEYEKAGELQWGGLMQDDVTDATKWLVDQDIAAPGNICIAGASYGGYAALIGTIKEPGLYACAISINGVTDLPRLKNSDKYGVIGGRAWTRTMGLEGVSDSDVSPHDRAKEISAPVLLMSSKDDTRIDYNMTKAMHRKLAGMNKESTYVEIADGGHHLDTAASRLTVLTELEKFLAKHIGN